MNTSCVWLSCHLTLLLRCHTASSLCFPSLSLSSLLIRLCCFCFSVLPLAHLSALSLPLDACLPVIFHLLYLPAISYPLFCSSSLTAFGTCVSHKHSAFWGGSLVLNLWEEAYMSCTDVMQYQCICKKLSGKVRVTGNARAANNLLCDYNARISRISRETVPVF